MRRVTHLISTLRADTSSRTSNHVLPPGPVLTPGPSLGDEIGRVRRQAAGNLPFLSGLNQHRYHILAITSLAAVPTLGPVIGVFMNEGSIYFLAPVMLGIWNGVIERDLLPIVRKLWRR